MRSQNNNWLCGTSIVCVCVHGVSVFANSPSLSHSLKHSFSFSLWPKKKSDTVNYFLANPKNLFSLPIQTFLFGMFFSIQLTIISTDHSNDGIFHTIHIWIEAKTQISHHFVWLVVCLFVRFCFFRNRYRSPNYTIITSTRVLERACLFNW